MDDIVKQVQGMGGNQAVGLGQLQGHALGNDFPEDQQQKGGRSNGNAHADIPEQGDGDRGDEDGYRNIDKFIANVDGDEKFPRFLKKGMNQRTGLAFFLFHFRQLEGIEGKERGFASGEKSRKQDENE